MVGNVTIFFLLEYNKHSLTWKEKNRLAISSHGSIWPSILFPARCFQEAHKQSMKSWLSSEADWSILHFAGIKGRASSVFSLQKTSCYCCAGSTVVLLNEPAVYLCEGHWCLTTCKQARALLEALFTYNKQTMCMVLYIVTHKAHTDQITEVQYVGRRCGVGQLWKIWKLQLVDSIAHVLIPR